eukprot:gnl/MRDRNA2_/MRDRNA2_91912_c0_seq1.p1 gnl/MRDRNA2_/MRDRNA2_91912_c0~~gnl/MRDRNA2_/MRDRNA2_91912_c0_seq1.p1  ORF type:complete len:127 (+),score=41.59 gnl/MRDRNA2_/MRDRNA2_91912_c0_seq1:69-449(+)
MTKGKAFRNNAKEARKQFRRRSSAKVQSSFRKETFAERKQKKVDVEEMRALERNLKEIGKEKRQLRARKKLEKKKRKDEAQILAGDYQVIKKTDKIRKWHKNAKKQLLVASPDMIDKILERKGTRV